MWCDGGAYEFETARRGPRRRPAETTATAASSRRCRAASAAILVGGGSDASSAAHVLLVLEAMKMEHAIRAPRDGVVSGSHVAEGDLVDAGVELVELA